MAHFKNGYLPAISAKTANSRNLPSFFFFKSELPVDIDENCAFQYCGGDVAQIRCLFKQRDLAYITLKPLLLEMILNTSLVTLFYTGIL